jgi:hypothetical protein
MQLTVQPLASNMTLLQTESALVLFSYATPVAVYDKRKHDYFKTAKKWSKTTTRHINKWLDGVQAQEMPQEFFDEYLGSV